MGDLGILWTIIIGVLAGAIAGWLMRGKGFGFIINLIVGLVGSIMGSFIYKLLGLGTSGVLGLLLMSVIGAAVLLWIISLFGNRKSG
ncbi:MAG: GlsB/YeaQ/YmgE family stress response membrane protein [Dysgonomonas sp.]